MIKYIQVIYVQLNSIIIGRRIKQKRISAGLTQETLAERIGFSKNHVSSIERGKYLPTTHFIAQLCSELGETPDYYLIGRKVDETDEIMNLIRQLPQDKLEMLCKLLETYIHNCY